MALAEGVVQPPVPVSSCRMHRVASSGSIRVTHDPKRVRVGDHCINDVGIFAFGLHVAANADTFHQRVQRRVDGGVVAGDDDGDWRGCIFVIDLWPVIDQSLCARRKQGSQLVGSKTLVERRIRAGNERNRVEACQQLKKLYSRRRTVHFFGSWEWAGCQRHIRLILAEQLDAAIRSGDGDGGVGFVGFGCRLEDRRDDTGTDNGYFFLCKGAIHKKRDQAHQPNPAQKETALLMLLDVQDGV